MGPMELISYFSCDSREKAELKLKETTAKLSQMETSRGDGEVEEIRAERDRLKEQAEKVSILFISAPSPLPIRLNFKTTLCWFG